MLIEYDSDKDAQDVAKHGISLSFARRLDWDSALVWVDERFAYDELRLIALAPETNIHVLRGLRGP